MATADHIDVQDALAGVDYPAGKDDLLAAARDHDADDTLLAQLAQLPADSSYDGPDEVNDALAEHVERT